ncbi:hypothetical protein ElyMa_004119800 [Elysia marginata]|uniref:Uncharacterized protein n=1 Tax=Elysia marginata TaxID=1093978 RepID=A0AAV4GDR9_9GAST|nr:hypothetical protein ElyMa_004119800 [Elysia marginata]
MVSLNYRILHIVIRTQKVKRWNKIGLFQKRWFMNSVPFLSFHTKEESKDAGTVVNGNNQSHEKAQDFGQYGGFGRDQETDDDIAFVNDDLKLGKNFHMISERLLNILTPL